MKSNQPPGYLQAILGALDPALIRPGSVGIVRVEHDATCRRPDGGRCTCSPDFRIVTVDPSEGKK